MALSEGLKILVSRLTTIKVQHLNKPRPVNSPESISKAEAELLETGNDLFTQFFNVGCQANKENLTSFRNSNQTQNLEPLVSNAGQLIVDTENWLHRFLCNYPDFRIHIDEHESIDKDVCIVRSGLQFMLDLFKGTNTTKLDDTLRYIEEEAVSDFDAKIKLGKEHTRFTVREADVPDHVPKTHVWWFTE